MNYLADHPALQPLAHDLPAAGVAQGTPLVLDDVADASRQKHRRLYLRELGAASNAEVAAASIREQQLTSEYVVAGALVGAAGAAAAGAPAWGVALGAQIQAQIQAEGVLLRGHIAQLSAQLARVANSSATRDVDALQPVPNAVLQMPNIWFPATRHHLRTCTAARAPALLQFYNIPAAAGPGTIQHRRCLAIALHIGMREYAPV